LTAWSICPLDGVSSGWITCGWAGGGGVSVGGVRVGFSKQSAIGLLRDE
jgi:hypothetical protein